MFNPMSEQELQRACGALNLGAPLRMAAEAALMTEARLGYWIAQECETGVALKLARQRGKLKLHGVVWNHAMHGGKYVKCEKCEAEFVECPECGEPLPTEGDPKWAMALLEKQPEYRQKIEMGPLQQDYQAAAEMSERELAAQLTRELCYPSPMTLQALKAALAKPGPQLLELLQSWGSPRQLVADTTAEEA